MMTEGGAPAAAAAFSPKLRGSPFCPLRLSWWQVLLVVSALGVICLVYFLLVLALANGFNDAVTTTLMHSSRCNCLPD